MIKILEYRGTQVGVRRIIALICTGLGLNLLIMGVSPVGPQGRASRTLALAAAAGCLLMATRWLRHRWPTAATSVGFVVAATACTVVMVVVPTDPGGEVPAVVMASALLTAYATCFHGGRLLLVTWMVIAAAIVDAALRGGAADPHFALGSALVIGGVNLVVAVASEMARRSVLHLDERDGVHRVSGLLTDVEFRVEVAKVLATRDAGANRHLVVAVLDIDGYSVVTGMTGPLGGLRARVAVGTALRDHVGRNVLVAHRSDSEFLVADVVSTSGVTSLMGNVRNAMAHSASRLTVSAGVVSTPLSPLRRCSAVDVLDEIVALATAAMADARRAGGNTVRCRVNPRLAAVGGSNCNPR